MPSLMERPPAAAGGTDPEPPAAAGGTDQKSSRHCGTSSPFHLFTLVPRADFSTMRLLVLTIFLRSIA
ncbi:MAG: hypothetical protein K1Y36_19815 [Blastocatellia bacterium]|nr:hypothetical protein [Blastocatellia bacterium]